jgi:alkanesulfonate monooxygenase SsuD/methylene tetrahydromethanopterin reductase-like flavin-dependent oxidoreductase (luciferase family)
MIDQCRTSASAVERSGNRGRLLRLISPSPERVAPPSPHFGICEHHREEYVASSPAVLLAAAATRTEKIRLTSAVTVLSSDDPVRVFQDFATLDLVSNGRAEIIVGRGSFIESYPLFGYDLKDYDELFAEKLDLLLQLRDEVKVHLEGKHRPSLSGQGVWPRPLQPVLRIRVGVGGTPNSFVPAGVLGLGALRWRRSTRPRGGPPP